MVIEPLSQAKWDSLVDELSSQSKLIAAWEPDDPNPDAERCEYSRHRTLAHLRAAQQTWLEVVNLFASNDDVSIVRPHPWRLFRDQGYETIPWETHMTAFLADRVAWQRIVEDPPVDRDRGGKLSAKSRTIASLTELMVNHEKHHLLQLKERAAKMRRRKSGA